MMYYFTHPQPIRYNVNLYDPTRPIHGLTEVPVDTTAICESLKHKWLEDKPYIFYARRPLKI